MDASAFGINGGWGGIRTTAAFVDKFSETQQILVANFIRMAKLKKSKNIGTYRWICDSEI
jgi:hypothetical protein